MRASWMDHLFGRDNAKQALPVPEWEKDDLYLSLYRDCLTRFSADPKGAAQECARLAFAFPNEWDETSIRLLALTQVAAGFYRALGAALEQSMNGGGGYGFGYGGGADYRLFSHWRIGAEYRTYSMTRKVADYDYTQISGVVRYVW